MSTKCVYCPDKATTEDTIGLPACVIHANEADEYFERCTGRKPNEDPHLFCDVHCDLWQPGCLRCEENSQYHYGINVAEFRKTPASKITILTGEINE